MPFSCPTVWQRRWPCCEQASGILVENGTPMRLTTAPTATRPAWSAARATLRGVIRPRAGRNAHGPLWLLIAPPGRLGRGRWSPVLAVAVSSSEKPSRCRTRREVMHNYVRPVTPPGLSLSCHSYRVTNLVLMPALAILIFGLPEVTEPSPPLAMRWNNRRPEETYNTSAQLGSARRRS